MLFAIVIVFFQRRELQSVCGIAAFVVYTGTGVRVTLYLLGQDMHKQ